MPSTPPEIEGEGIGPTQRGRPGCDWRSDYVSQTNVDAGDDAIADRCTYLRSVAEMQRKVDRRSKRNGFVRFILTKGDKDEIAGWNQDLIRILHVFNVRSIGSAGNQQLSPF